MRRLLRRQGCAASGHAESQAVVHAASASLRSGVKQRMSGPPAKFEPLDRESVEGPVRTGPADGDGLSLWRTPIHEGGFGLYPQPWQSAGLQSGQGRAGTQTCAPAPRAPVLPGPGPVHDGTHHSPSCSTIAITRHF